MSEMRRWIYLVLVAGLGGAAAARLGAAALSMALEMLRIKALRVVIYDCPVPLVCRFDNPARTLMEWLLAPLSRGWAIEEPFASAYFTFLHKGPLVIAALLLALAVRRAIAWRAARSIDPPASFAEFPFWLAVLGLVLMVVGAVDVPLVQALLGHGQPGGLGLTLAFIAFAWVEIASLRRGPAGGAPAGEGAGEGALPAAAPPRRRPVWTVISIMSPLVGVMLAVAVLILSPRAEHGLGIVIVAAIPVIGGLVVGALATVVALVRRERWVPLQLLAFLVNFGVGAPLLLSLLPK